MADILFVLQELSGSEWFTGDKMLILAPFLVNWRHMRSSNIQYVKCKQAVLNGAIGLWVSVDTANDLAVVRITRMNVLKDLRRDFPLMSLLHTSRTTLHKMCTVAEKVSLSVWLSPPYLNYTFVFYSNFEWFDFNPAFLKLQIHECNPFVVMSIRSPLSFVCAPQLFLMKISGSISSGSLMKW